MSGCGTFKCARRLYEGHGQSSYRPVNPELAAENSSRLSKMQMEREAQDRLWQNTSLSGQSHQDSGSQVQTMVLPERKLPVLPDPVYSPGTPYVARPVWSKSFQTK